MQRGFGVIFLVILIAVFVFVVGGVYFLNNKNKTDFSPSPLPSSSVVQNETANWKTYTNIKYGYSIKYPSDLYFVKNGQKVSEDATNTDPYISIEPTNAFNSKEPLVATYAIGIYFTENIDNLNLDDPKNILGNGPIVKYPPEELEGKTIQNITLGGMTAYKVSNLNAGQVGTEEAEIMTIKNDNVIQILVSPRQGMGYENKNLALYNQILSTFKFLNYTEQTITEEENDLLVCIKGKEENNKTEFVKGDVLVRFKDGVSFEEAIKIVEDYKLNYEDNLRSFDQSLVLEVKVSKGQEFSWVCQLEENPQVKFAEVNNVIKIPDCNKGPC